MLTVVAPHESDPVRVTDAARVEAWRVVQTNLHEKRAAREVGAPLPSLRDAVVSGLVRYVDKRLTGGVQEFAPIGLVLSRGFGHCVDLACWEIADEIERGDRPANPARPVGQPGCVDFAFSLWRGPGHSFGHVMVRRANGELFDISKYAGM